MVFHHGKEVRALRGKSCGYQIPWGRPILDPWDWQCGKNIINTRHYCLKGVGDGPRAGIDWCINWLNSIEFEKWTSMNRSKKSKRKWERFCTAAWKKINTCTTVTLTHVRQAVSMNRVWVGNCIQSHNLSLSATIRLCGNLAKHWGIQNAIGLCVNFR